MAIWARTTWKTLQLIQNSLISSHSFATKKLEELGGVEHEKLGQYSSGQCFIHRTFAYRGVILCSWKAQMMDRDDKESPKIETYYQVLIDERDNAHIKVSPDVGRFLGRFVLSRVHFRFTDTGLDQVAHKEIIPFRPTSATPIHHKLFNDYFIVRQIKGDPVRRIVAKIALNGWKRKHLPWLYHTQVHKMITENIRVTAMSLYMGRRSVTHWWRYWVRIENLNKEPVQLQGQRWGIYTGNGELQTVRGIGILGNLPTLSSKVPAIQYSSHVTLLAPRGHMWGYYLVHKQGTKRAFLCPVPSFALDSALGNNTTIKL